MVKPQSKRHDISKNEFYRRALLVTYNYLLEAHEQSRLKLKDASELCVFIDHLDALKDCWMEHEVEGPVLDWKVSNQGSIEFIDGNSKMKLEERRRRLCLNITIGNWLIDLSDDDDFATTVLNILETVATNEEYVKYTDWHITENGTVLFPENRRKHRHGVAVRDALVAGGRKGGSKKVTKGFGSKTEAERSDAGKKGAAKRWNKPSGDTEAGE